MIHVYAKGADGKLCLADTTGRAASSGASVWVDLLHPSPDQERAVEAALGIDAPTPEERRAIEDSARLFEENGAITMIASVLLLNTHERPEIDPVAFILSKGKLVTVRTMAARAFQIGKGRAAARIETAANGADVFTALIEGIVERIADLLDRARDEADALAKEVFETSEGEPNLRAALRTLGSQGRMAAKARDSLSSLQRVVQFAASAAERHGLDKERLLRVGADLRELDRQSEALASTLTYILDASLGLSSVSQNAAMKTMATVTVLFTPPIFVASIYGMNFEFMPELHARAGYPTALLTMVIASISLFVIGKWRRWF